MYRVSASQINTFRSCQRKWAWRKVDRLESIPHPSAVLGTEIHKVLEDYLGNGTPPDPETKQGAIALAGLQHLPKPGTGKVEGFFSLTFAGEDFELIGYIDWQDDCTVLDHKSTSDFKWALKAPALIEDVQANVYAAAKFIATDAESVECRWVYYRTRKKPRSRVVSVRMRREECEARLEPILDTAREIVQAFNTCTTALDLPPTVLECDAYGGCQYAKQCNLSSRDRLKGLMSQQSLREKVEEQETEHMATLAERLAAKNKAKQEEAPAPVNPPGEAETAPAVETTTTTTKKPRKPKMTTAAGGLRDDFAVAAMTSIVGARIYALDALDRIASEAYALADAMMKAR